VLEIPSDVLTAEGIEYDVGFAEDLSTFPRSRPRPPTEQILAAAKLVADAERPVLVAGGGVLLSRADAEVCLLASRFGIPVATTFNGKGSIPETDSHAIGVIGGKGSGRANSIVANADLVIWVGSKGGDKSTNFGRLPSRTSTTIQIDIDPCELGRTFPIALGLCGDAKATLQELLLELDRRGWKGIRDGWPPPRESLNPLDTLKEKGFLTTPSILEAIKDLFDVQPIVVADASRACGWIGSHFRTSRQGRSVIAPRGSGSIGYALPGTIAAALACPGQPVVGIGGDAGFAIASHELETAVRVHASFLFLILDNSAPALLNQVSRLTLGHAVIPEFVPTDWAAVATAFGIQATRVTTLDELSSWRHSCVDIEGPQIVDLVLAVEETSPDFELFQTRHDQVAR
jgi:acetolactate synthase-1/2/3 large subunit